MDVAHDARSSHAPVMSCNTVSDRCCGFLTLPFQGPIQGDAQESSFSGR